MKLFDAFRLDVVNQSLWHGDRRVPLMPKPFAVLQYLVERAGRLVTQEQLLKAVWPETYVQADVLRRYVMEIRRALGDRASAPRFIQTFPKRGFQFIASVIDQPDVTAAGATSTTKLVGRVSALADLERHLCNALGNRRQVVFVVGECGIGKTSLVDSFQHRASSHAQTRVARGQCVEGFGSKEPYYPVLEALGQLVRSNARAPIVETLATHAPTWMVEFHSLVQQDRRAALQHEVRGATRERMVRELCEALDVITQTVPILLVLEDLHWADPSTLDLVSAIARRREPAKLLLVGTFRPGDTIVSESPLKGLSHDLKLHRLSHELQLERLSESDVAEYLEAAFAPGRLPKDLAALIHKHSDGNPLFMTAMLDHLEQHGVLSQQHGYWTLTAPLQKVDPGVPETLRQMLEMQLEHLTETERRMLECASVAGQHFTAWSVATMLVRDPSAVEEKCQALADGQQFLKLSGTRALAGRAVTLEYEFRHALYREVLYRRLSPSECVNFHRHLAAGLESLRSPVQPELAAEIALHFEEGREYERAVRYLLLAAENATRRHAYLESISVLEHARALLVNVTHEQQAILESQILERIADAQYTLGDVERSLQTYDDMAVKAARAGLRIAEATALMRMAHPAAFVDSTRCVTGCERAASIGAEIGNPTLETHARLLASCWRIMNEGWNNRDAAACAKSIATLRALGADLPPYDQILHARVQIFQSQYADACHSAERALEKLTEAHALWVRAKALSTKANALLFWGRLGEAHGTVMAGIELAKKNENAPWLGILLSTLAWLRWETFDFEGLEALSHKVEEFARSASGPQMWLRATANVAGGTMRNLQGFADLAAGRYDQALQRFGEIRDHPRAPRFGLSWQRRMFAELGHSETLLAIGELTRATIEADTLVKDVSDHGDMYLKARAWEMRTRVAMAVGNRDAAQRYLQGALAAVSGCDVPLAAWRVHATGWDVYRQTNSARAQMHRSTAAKNILDLAASLTQVDSLYTSFLSAVAVRRVLDDEWGESLNEALTPPLVEQS
jgi:DNA-binding winged helix-turn-helix (wHTH) protein/tetratricopeptide (TPR) repeat protein